MIEQKSSNLTLVLPVYNEEQHIKAALKSIAAQSELPDEVIIVDNNSTDNSVQIAKQFKFVKVVKESRQGLVFARNRGFNEAKYQIICRIDADSILPPDWVARVKQQYKKAGSPNLFAATGPVTFRNGGPKFFWNGLHRVTYFWFSNFLLGSQTVFGPNTVISQDLWRKLEPIVCLRNDIHEDMDLAAHIHELGVPVRFHKSLKQSVLARQMLKRSFTYPVMMLKIRLISHQSLSA